jgi:hypothetical protein
MAQAGYVTNVVRPLITDAGSKPSTNPIHTAHAELVTAVAGQPPCPIPPFPGASDLEDRAEHLKKMLNAVSVYLVAILDDTARNVPGGLDLRSVDALLSDLASDVTGAVQGAADDMTGRIG